MAAQGLFPQRQWAEFTEPGLCRDENHERDVTETQGEVAHPMPAAPYADQEEGFAQHHERDDANV